MDLVALSSRQLSPHSDTVRSNGVGCFQGRDLSCHETWAESRGVEPSNVSTNPILPAPQRQSVKPSDSDAMERKLPDRSNRADDRA